jgi:hypothetical protein
MMRKTYLRIWIGVIGIACSGVAANAQAVDQIEAKIPHEFVVGGKTFPPGSYKVERATTSNDRELLIRNVDTKESVLIAPTEVESSSTDHPALSFEHVGDELLLSKIETADHIFTISVPRSEIMEAQAKSHSGTSAPASAAGSN